MITLKFTKEEAKALLDILHGAADAGAETLDEFTLEVLDDVIGKLNRKVRPA